MKSKIHLWIIILSLFMCFFLGILFEKNVALKRFFTNERFKEEMEKHPARAMDPLKEALGNVKIYILAGQSNMSGYGEMDPEEFEVNARVLVFGNDYRWRLAKEPIDDPTGQVDPVSLDKNPGFSCGTAFAKTLLMYHPKVFIGLIPCAKNGSSIDEWQRNLSEDSLYGSCLKRALAASPMGRISGMLFFQGETDALEPSIEPERVKSPYEWGAKFSRFVKDLRNDLKRPNIPVVFAQIGVHQDPKAFKNWKIVQQQQSQVRIPYCKMIKTDDLTLRDVVHFDNRSYRILGERFALTMNELLSKGN